MVARADSFKGSCPYPAACETAWRQKISFPRHCESRHIKTVNEKAGQITNSITYYLMLILGSPVDGSITCTSLLEIFIMSIDLVMFCYMLTPNDLHVLF
jgi:hypothetical protein